MTEAGQNGNGMVAAEEARSGINDSDESEEKVEETAEETADVTGKDLDGRLRGARGSMTERADLEQLE